MRKHLELFEKIWFVLLCSLFAFPILPRGVESVMMIAFALASILLIASRRVRSYHFQNTNGIAFAILSTLPIAYLLSLTYTDNLAEGLGQVIRVSPLLLFPIVFGFIQKNMLTESQITSIKITYLLSVTCALLWLLVLLFEELFDPGITTWELRQMIESSSGVHGTYLSIWIGFALILLLTMQQWQLRKNSIVFLLTSVLMAFFFIFWQFKIGARAPLLATALLLVAFIFLRFYKRVIPLTILLLSLGMGIYYASSRTQVFTRIKEAFVWDEHNLPEGDYAYVFKEISSEDIRKGIYFCSWDLAVQSAWLGYGVGDVQERLDHCYRENISSNVYQKFLFNTHNQYFHVLLAAGIIALIAFLISLFWPLILSFRYKDFLLFSITSLISICLFTENVISRHDGVIFYSLFSSMLIFNCLKRDEKSSGT